MVTATNLILWQQKEDTVEKMVYKNRQKYANDSVHWFMSELTSRIVAVSGVPSDRFHLGKMILQSLKDAPNFVSQIDGGSNKSETNESVLERSVRCAVSLKAHGVKKGDVMALMAPSHLDFAIPYYAALYLGIIVAPINKDFTIDELQDSFHTSNPKMIFCQSEKVQDVRSVLMELKIEAKIVVFDGKKDEIQTEKIFSEFLECDGSAPFDYFKPADFDAETTIALLIESSGTTGTPKAVAVTHKNIAITGPYPWTRYTCFPTPTHMTLVISPNQWLSAIVHFNMSPIIRYTRLQTSQAVTQQHVYDLINIYEPTFATMSSTVVTSLFKAGDRERCDFTCFECIMFGGSAVPTSLLEEIKEVVPNVEGCDVYGLTELTTIAFQPDFAPPGSCGKPIGHLQYRLVDIEKNEDILEENERGELWLKGPGVFQGYYNNPEATKATFSNDGWFKTGDIFYRDDKWNFFFVDRIHLLINYRGHKVSPLELEMVIGKHPGVSQAAVTGMPDPKCGEIPIACVVPNVGFEITAQDIMEFVKVSLEDFKQVGRVVFVDEIPMTPTAKINRRELKYLMLKMITEELGH